MIRTKPAYGFDWTNTVNVIYRGFTRVHINV